MPTTNLSRTPPAKLPFLEAWIFTAGAVALAAAAALSHRLHGPPASVNPHAAYAARHLAPALYAAAAFCLAVALGYVVARRRTRSFEGRSTGFFLGWIGLLFCVFWLPVLLAGGFVQDDWLLLAAASVRHVIVAHPATSWLALDSVDGNFRPLGTVLYVSYLYKMFGMAPRIFLLGNFLLDLGGVVTAYLLMRELGYTKVAGAIAAILYLSRGVLFTQAGWVSALGDCIVNFLTAVIVLVVLKAMRRTDARALGLHGLAWGLFVVSVLAKQSAYTIPLVVAALLWIRPGPMARLPWKQRLTQAATAFAVYGGTAAVVALHAKELLGKQTPYPLGISGFTVVRSFAYVFWYFETLYSPTSELFRHAHAAGPFVLGGMALVAVLGYALVRYRWLMGERPRDLRFLTVAAVCSILPFLVVADRNEAYYGTMLAFWLSLVLAVVVTHLRSAETRRMASFAVCALVAFSYLDVRLKQVGFLWPGGYFWGNADIDVEGARLAQIHQLLATAPAGSTAILIDPPLQGRFYASMVILGAPQVERVLIYDSKTGAYLANDRGGLLPVDGVAALRDMNAYKWATPVEPGAGARLRSDPKVVRLQYEDGGFVAADR